MNQNSNGISSICVKYVIFAELERAENNSALCNQSFLNENACSGDKSSAKVLFEHPSTTFVHTKT